MITHLYDTMCEDGVPVLTRSYTLALAVGVAELPRDAAVATWRHWGPAQAAAWARCGRAGAAARYGRSWEAAWRASSPRRGPEHARGTYDVPHWDIARALVSASTVRWLVPSGTWRALARVLERVDLEEAAS